MLKVEIATENAAFDEHGSEELARILRELAGRIESFDGRIPPGVQFPLRDINGNRVGAATMLKSED